MSIKSLPEKDVHILCVDDDVDFVNSLSLVLPEKMHQMYEGNDYLRFSFFTSPLEALEALHELQEMNEQVALIISDQKMPVMQATEFIAKAKLIFPSAYCVLLTGFAGIEAAVNAINGKLLDRYLTKPIDNENEFVIALLQMLDSYEMSCTITNQSKALNDLYEFSNRLNSISDYDSALNYVVNFTKSALDCERVSIMLLGGRDSSYLKIAAASGISEDIINTTKVKIGEGVSGGVFENKEAIYAKDVTELGYVLESRHQDEAIFISMPLLWANLQSAGQPVGVINATEKTNGQAFTQQDLEMLTYISNTASIAINNLSNSKKLNTAYIEAKTHAAALSHLMAHDTITTLPNHQSFSTALRETIEASRRVVRPVSIVVLNLLRFREINCTVGHHSGDNLLVNISRQLLELISDEQHLFHIGGDEFALILPGCVASDTQGLISAIQDKFCKPIEIDGTPVDTDFTFGIASFPDHASNYKLLMQKADIALHQAKEKKKTIQIYESDSDVYNAHRLAMVNELRSAIQSEQLCLYYQPKLDLVSGNVEGCEALVRWIHPERGFTPPDHFIPLAEQVGLMEELTDWVVRRAVKDCASWNTRNIYPEPITVAVNLSTMNLLEENFANKMSAICEEYKLPTHLLNFEITESVIMNNLELALTCLNQLSDLGFHIHLDDFGTGYSSLAYIKRLPLNAVKIDRSFIMNIDEDAQDEQIVHSIVELGHSLKLKLIAEGVENQEAVNLLQSLHCDSVQGYLYSPPLSLKDFEAWVVDYEGKCRLIAG